jgi:chromosome segregation ATPase
VATINQVDLVWRAAQNRLEELGSGCVSDATQIIDQARDAKLKSVASYAKYYQDTISYWTKSRDSSGEAELSSRTDSAELQAHVNQLQLELQSVNRRKADLDRTFGENHIDNNDERAALQDLTRIQTNKQEQVEKARAALDQNKAGHEWVMKRKEYARVRLSETSELLQSTRTELYLYQQLYNAILYRHSLSCDREVSRPMETLSDWRQDLKKLSPPPE